MPACLNHKRWPAKPDLPGTDTRLLLISLYITLHTPATIFYPKILFSCRHISLSAIHVSARDREGGAALDEIYALGISAPACTGSVILP